MLRCILQAMSEDGSDYPNYDDDDDDYGGGDDDEQEDKELLIECGQRQVRRVQRQLGGSAAVHAVARQQCGQRQVRRVQRLGGSAAVHAVARQQCGQRQVRRAQLRNVHCSSADGVCQSNAGSAS
jgi:hypothetical protein